MQKVIPIYIAKNGVNVVNGIVGISTNRIHNDLMIQQVGGQTYTKIRYNIDPTKSNMDELLTPEDPSYIYREMDNSFDNLRVILPLVGGGTISIPTEDIIYCYMNPATYQRSSVDALVGNRRVLYNLNMTFMELLSEINATPGSRIAITTRVTSTPYDILVTDEVLFVNTDDTARTVNLPVGAEGMHYKIINTGSSGNDVTADPQVGEELYGGGAGIASTVSDGEVINIHYNVIDGWW